MVLAEEAVLAGIAERVELVAPVAPEVEPLAGGGRGQGRRAQVVAPVVVRVGVVVERRVPERPAVRHVVQDAARQDVRVHARRGVHGVGAGGGEAHGLGMG